MPSDNAAAWDRYAAAYQSGAQLSTGTAHYGPDIPTEAELRQTSFVEMTIEEASAKQRSGGVKHLAIDEGWPAWSGVLPVELRIGQAIPDPALGAQALGLAGHAPLAEGAKLDEALSAAAIAARAPA